MQQKVLVNVGRCEQAVLAAGLALVDAVLVQEGQVVAGSIAASGPVTLKDGVEFPGNLQAVLLVLDRAENAFVAAEAGFEGIETRIGGGDIHAEASQLGLKAVDKRGEGLNRGGVVGDLRFQAARIKGSAGLVDLSEQAGDGDRELVACHRATAAVGAVGIADDDAGFLEGVNRLVGPVVGRDVRERAGRGLCVGDGGQADEGHSDSGEKH